MGSIVYVVRLTPHGSESKEVYVAKSLSESMELVNNICENRVFCSLEIEPACMENKNLG